MGHQKTNDPWHEVLTGANQFLKDHAGEEIGTVARLAAVAAYFAFFTIRERFDKKVNIKKNMKECEEVAEEMMNHVKANVTPPKERN